MQELRASWTLLAMFMAFARAAAVVTRQCSSSLFPSAAFSSHPGTVGHALLLGRCRALHLLSATTRTATAEPAALELCVRHDGAALRQRRHRPGGGRVPTPKVVSERGHVRVERILPLLKLIAAPFSRGRAGRRQGGHHQGPHTTQRLTDSKVPGVLAVHAGCK